MEWTNWNIKMSLDTLKLSVYLPYTRKGIPPFDATDWAARSPALAAANSLVNLESKVIIMIYSANDRTQVLRSVSIWCGACSSSNGSLDSQCKSRSFLQAWALACNHFRKRKEGPDSGNSQLPFRSNLIFVLSAEKLCWLCWLSLQHAVVHRLILNQPLLDWPCSYCSVY